MAKDKRKHRMQATEGAPAASGAPESTPHADVQAAMLAMLEQVAGQVATLAARLDTVEREAGPHFAPASPAGLDADLDHQDRIANAVLDGIPRSTHLPVFANGERVPEFLMKQLRPKFGTGSRVRLNLDAVPHGREDGKTRGQLAREAGAPNGPGEVFSALYLSDEGRWKYRVRFDKRVMPGAVNGVVALYEYELLSA